MCCKNLPFSNIPLSPPSSFSSPSTPSSPFSSALPQTLPLPFLTLIRIIFGNNGLGGSLSINVFPHEGQGDEVSGKLELEMALRELFADAKILESRQKAAKEAFHSLSTTVVSNA
ncbi:hypothetical protein F3Y22_tig00109980pilonHSYRG00133 [Hibiscus syriacus]|uniref:Uncharacterized protein n=1 Tax=Hibiscus syriacus TaxID=106335 RepID=A0A6A3BVV4_HIBSY|nr:hypothetical protein F3Y22_tig00109980pilonHSYRG00133 [Hibiscus syriacus]